MLPTVYFAGLILSLLLLAFPPSCWGFIVLRFLFWFGFFSSQIHISSMQSSLSNGFSYNSCMQIGLWLQFWYQICIASHCMLWINRHCERTFRYNSWVTSVINPFSAKTALHLEATWSHYGGRRNHITIELYAMPICQLYTWQWKGKSCYRY